MITAAQQGVLRSAEAALVSAQEALKTGLITIEDTSAAEVLEVNTHSSFFLLRKKICVYAQFCNLQF